MPIMVQICSTGATAPDPWGLSEVLFHDGLVDGYDGSWYAQRTAGYKDDHRPLHILISSHIRTFSFHFTLVVSAFFNYL